MNKFKVYIIAEIGPNHNGDLNIALSMVEKIAKTGANAVKFQLTNPYLLYSKDSFKAKYQKIDNNDNNVLEMSLKNQLSKNEHIILYNFCKKKGIDYICTAFDIDSLTFLDSNFDMPYFKIASGEIFSLDLLDYISKRNKPIILSTGMATYDEIKLSLDYLNKNFEKDITILHCISNYPAKYNETNLNNLIKLKQLFSLKIGFSDHTIGNECSIASVAMGAAIIEKHVTFNKAAKGPDHKASISISEFKNLVSSIRNVEVALGTMERRFSKDQKEISKVARKSIVSKHYIKEGSVICEEDICFKRPGIGFLPFEKDKIIGKTSLCDIEKDRVIKQEYLK
jgi:N,N'-diacetyllegionaminate synthase